MDEGEESKGSPGKRNSLSKMKVIFFSGKHRVEDVEEKKIF